MIAIPRELLAAGGALLLCTSAGLLVYVSLTDPRAPLPRLGTSYVAGLDRSLRGMFLPARGALIASGQLACTLALLASYAFVPASPLLWAALAAIVAPPVFVRMMVTRRRRRLDNQVHGFALAFANALKTTASIGEALQVVVTVTAKPLRDELETALKQMRVGSALDEALLAMSARAQATSLDVVVSALLIGRLTGGDLPNILETTAASLRELKRLEELTERVTRTAKQSLAVAAGITTSLAVFLPRVMPGFFDPLRDTVKGQVVALQCAIVFFAALYLGWRFTRTDI